MADQSIQSNHQQLPQNLSILKVNFDTENELKQKYDVAVQHTFVQLNRQGQEVTKWQGGNIEQILENIK